jgi:cell shape-determining protein MreC
MEDFVHFENFFQNHRAYKKNLRAIEQEKAETQSVEAQNTRMKEHREHYG